jgi:hypothetical protein
VCGQRRRSHQAKGKRLDTGCCPHSHLPLRAI